MARLRVLDTQRVDEKYQSIKQKRADRPPLSEEEKAKLKAERKIKAKEPRSAALKSTGANNLPVKAKSDAVERQSSVEEVKQADEGDVRSSSRPDRPRKERLREERPRKAEGSKETEASETVARQGKRRKRTRKTTDKTSPEESANTTDPVPKPRSQIKLLSMSADPKSKTDQTLTVTTAAPVPEKGANTKPPKEKSAPSKPAEAPAKRKRWDDDVEAAVGNRKQKLSKSVGQASLPTPTAPEVKAAVATQSGVQKVINVKPSKIKKAFDPEQLKQTSKDVTGSGWNDNVVSGW